MRVFVYKNLHKDCYSVKALEGPNKGRVIAHKNSLYISNPVFTVQKAGRQKVLNEKRKNVHAGIKGNLIKSKPRTTELLKVTYNPYKYSTFVLADFQEPIYKAKYAVCKTDGVWVDESTRKS